MEGIKAVDKLLFNVLLLFVFAVRIGFIITLFIGVNSMNRVMVENNRLKLHKLPKSLLSLWLLSIYRKEYK